MLKHSKWGIVSKVPSKGEFYAEFDEEASQWGVFHTDTNNTMYQCNGTEEDAKAKAKEYNKK